MMQQLSFNELKINYFDKLDKFITVVDRVHGNSHPEIHEVKRIWEIINRKIKLSKDIKPELTNEFLELKNITNNYFVPGDVCETFEWVYNVLKATDLAYQEL